MHGDVYKIYDLANEITFPALTQREKS